jgi:hypothetical protein
MDPIAEADAFLADIERYVPWLLEWPDRFLQVDLEKWPTDPVPAAEGIAYGNRLVDKFDGLVMMYASHGQYSNQLAPWQGLLWNANYGSNPVGEFKAVYPGDNSPGWAPYSGRTPTLLQYGSRTTIAGLTTCDADAFRGTEDQLRAIIRGAQKGGAADMTMIIAVDANHQHYVSDFQTSRKITPQTVNDYVWMAKNHGLALVHNATSPDFVEGGWVHGNWNSETYGPEQTAPSGGGGLSDTDKAAIQGCTDACSATAAAAGDCKTSVDALNSRLSTP